MMVVATGCGTLGNNYKMSQGQVVTNLTRRVAYLKDRDIGWQAFARQQTVQVAQANQKTEMVLKTAEEAVRTAERLKRQTSAVSQGTPENVGIASASVGYGNEPYTKPACQLHGEPQHEVNRSATLLQAKKDLVNGEKTLKELELQLQKLSQ